MRTAAPGPQLARLFTIVSAILSLLVAVAGEHVALSGSSPSEGSLVHVLIQPEGSRVRLKCSIRSSKVFWTKDGVAVECGAGGCRPTLRLKNVTRRDSGMYQCWLPRGRLVQPSIRLKVMEEDRRTPQLLDPWPSNVSVVAGTPTSLRCLVQSALPPNIQWLRRLENTSNTPLTAHADLVAANKTIYYEGDTYEVLSSNGEAALANHSYLSKLSVSHTSEDDTGLYICLATNNHGYTFRGAFLTVLPRAPAGLLVPQGLQHVEVALIVLVIILVASPVLALMYLSYAHRQALIARKQPTPVSL